MSHDFAKKPKATPKKKATQKKSHVPGWVWLLTGIVTGIFISFLSYLADITPAATPVTSNTNTAVVEKKTSNKKSTATKFDFYTLLPEREVIVPTQREEDSSETAPATLYILQAGSFKNAKDADRLRAQLILLGLNAKVEKVQISSGERWHRVEVGPFTNSSQLSKARSILIDQGIDSLLFKRKA
ncbi:MAG: SPOR domain-containing protein [Spongiibacteraceae bacterium]